VSLNLAETITGSAERHPDRPALRLGDIDVAYAELDRDSARLATLLGDNGVERGDRVAIMLPNVPQFPISYYGILRAGGIVVPMNVLLKKREISFFLEDSGARLLLAWHGFTEEARAGAEQASAELIEVEPAAFSKTLEGMEVAPGLADTDESDTAVILYTSGTTGQPKGAELTHLNLSLNAEIVAETLTEVGPEDVVLGALPQFHSFGQTATLNASLREGACVVMLPRFDPGDALEAMQRERVTVFQGVPTMYGAMLNFPGHEEFDTSSLRNCMTGGAAMPVEVMRGFEEEFGCKLLEGYGLSETSPVACSNRPDRERKPGSIGVPVRGVEMQIVDEDDNPLPTGEPGEVVIRGHNIMKGYWKRPDATAEAMRGGWFHSGDIGRTDEDGYFYIVDRKKDLIIRGGYNVFPREVEEVLYEHPAVQEAAVVGIPDDSLGEEVGAAVVLRDGASASAEDLSQHVKSELAAYKYPRQVWFIDELPKGPTGKILKREIQPPAAASPPD
jgi:long-chain acyl-CoA synthetase